MYTGYLYPFYRSWGPGYGAGYGYGAWGPGYPSWGYGGFGNNVIGSAIANQSVINTGAMAGTTQIATPTVIGY
jgi:hypothetical protein